MWFASEAGKPHHISPLRVAASGDKSLARYAEVNSYPNKEFVMALDLGTKVAKGEMKWG